MKKRHYEIDPDGIILDDETSEDVMDLDHTEVLSFLDINHEMLPKDEGVGFYEAMEDRLDALEALDNAELEAQLDKLMPEVFSEG